MHAALAYGAMRGRNVVNERVARQVAHLLVSKNSQQVNAVKLIAAKPQMIGALRLTSSNLASLGSRSIAPVVSRRSVPNVAVAPAGRRQALINAVAAQGGAAQPDQ